MGTFDQFCKTFPEESQAKGAAFEEFLVCFLQNLHPLYKHKFANVWPFSEWPDKPDDWSPKATGSKEIGTDIIAEDVDGKIWAIQAKFHPTDWDDLL
jgi:predicted helicase